MSVEFFDFDREDIESSSFDKYDGEPGNTDRVGILYEDGGKLVRGAKIHFKDRYFLCKSTKEKSEICCTHLYDGNEGFYRCGCAIIIYDLIIQDNKPKLKGYKILPWYFTATIYNKLQEADREFSIKEHDIKLKCSKAKYKTYDIISCKESIWRANPEMKEKILKEAAPVFERLSKGIAADLSIAEIRELLGIESAGADDAATDVDLQSVVSSI